MSTLRIRPEMVAAFMEASHDRNPLHIDADYARTTSFGQPVVYGVLGLLRALGEWSQGNAFQIAHMKAVFKKPLFVDVEYAFKAEERDGRVYLSLGRGPIEYLQLNFSRAELLPTEAGSLFSFDPRQPELDPALPCDFRYAADVAGISKLVDLLGLANGLPSGQMSALLWSSYWIGMVNPGERALFAELELEFTAANTNPCLDLQLQPSVFDARFNRITQTGTGTGIGKLRLVAFVRPKQIALDWDMLRPQDGEKRNWAGKRVFISGAGRGFGAALAAKLGFAGAQLALNVRSGAATLGYRFADEGLDAEVFTADLTQGPQVETMALGISEGQPLDLLVLNATPSIRNAWLLEQSSAEFMEFLNASTAMTVLSLRALLPMLSEHATVMLISTVYLEDPQRGFSHYLAAKAGQEALMEALSQETRGIRFLVVRLPRMLTDQTNVPFDHHIPPKAEFVAGKLMEALDAWPMEPGFGRMTLELPEEGLD